MSVVDEVTQANERYAAEFAKGGLPCRRAGSSRS
jgi:hypothetical protein